MPSIPTRAQKKIPLQTRRVRARVSVLPKGSVPTSSRKGTKGRRPIRNPQRVVGREGHTAGTSGPPVGV
ncbi:hypothetical protein L210DRAFT_3576766 [Boletus edulis BED1]|uniref:Uncharacterized protein n=1 Tax=Boletus edulis BED1 TaxID=1328754 RepID=A0AAD4G6P1_BOLED|nr:hypothetical protein L210DRAFT_3576766 [Boletus edulis BED1]